MKIVLIHGSPRKRGNTYTAAHQVLEAMRERGPVECTEFFMPGDLPELCAGCASCVLNGEDTCPHAAHTLPILEAMLAADALIVTTPVFVLAESGAIKNFLDHFCYLFIVHRAQPCMFAKKALVLCTTLGGGARRAMGAVAVSLKFWGINRVRRLALPMRQMSWDKVSPKRRARSQRRLQKAAGAFYREVAGGRRRMPYPILYVMYTFIRRMMKTDAYDDGSLDKRHWEERGWLRKRPF
ncbi:MAG: NAD(P)H-dependent oxidoreductase [Clostridia bacterium]|nr:NAD(P)H-dependent oxidoreductase [Clostridia bacterium]